MTTTTRTAATIRMDIAHAKTRRDELQADLTARPERRGIAWHNDRVAAVHAAYGTLARLEDELYAAMLAEDAAVCTVDESISDTLDTHEIMADWASVDTDADDLPRLDVDDAEFDEWTGRTWSTRCDSPAAAALDTDDTDDTAYADMPEAGPDTPDDDPIIF